MAERADHSDDEAANLGPSSYLCTETQQNISLHDNTERANERSSLLPPETYGSVVKHPISQLNSPIHDELQETKSLWYMVLLTISIGGLQLAWSVELSYGSPYLLSLGVSKSMMALVWIAGPLSGTLMQPYVGMRSDDCRSRWGKRTPFIVFGSVATIISLLALAWTPQVVIKFLGIFGADSESQVVNNGVILFAVLFVYILDFAINTVQAGIRAFILDCTPSHQQEASNSMASRAVGVGNIIGYVAGFVNLKHYLGILGNSQFQILCAIACIALGTTVALSVLSIRERDPNREAPPAKGRVGLAAFFRTIFISIRCLPLLTKQVCKIQLFVWVGYFPQLFYSSSYIADIYVQPYLKENPNMTPIELNLLYEKATRVGSFALLIYAITSLSANVVLPLFIAPSYDSHLISSASSRDSSRIFRFFDVLVIPGFTIRRAWFYSHLIFAACMFSNLFIRSITAATVLIGILGIPWALTQWAPYAIISAELSKREALRRSRIISASAMSISGQGSKTNVDQAGVILGIHNMSIAAPQIIASIGSSIIFYFLQKPRGSPGDRSFSAIFAAGGMSILIAAWLTNRMKDEIIISDDDESINEM